MELIRAAIAQNGGTQSEVARQWGISVQYLGDILRGRREPGKAVLDALGLEKRVEYVRKGE